MTTPPPDPREALAEVLAEATWMRRGWLPPASAEHWARDDFDDFGKVLADYVARLLADREAEALERAAAELDGAPDDPRWTASLLGYHGEGEWLRARAQEVRRG